MGVKSAPMSSGGRRYSGFMVPPDGEDGVGFDFALTIRSEMMPIIKRPKRAPMPIPRKLSPDDLVGKWYWVWNTEVNVVNMRYW